MRKSPSAPLRDLVTWSVRARPDTWHTAVVQYLRTQQYANPEASALSQLALRDDERPLRPVHLDAAEHGIELDVHARGGERVRVRRRPRRRSKARRTRRVRKTRRAERAKGVRRAKGARATARRVRATRRRAQARPTRATRRRARARRTRRTRARRRRTTTTTTTTSSLRTATRRSDAAVGGSSSDLKEVRRRGGGEVVRPSRPRLKRTATCQQQARAHAFHPSRRCATPRAPSPCALAPPHAAPLPHRPLPTPWTSRFLSTRRAARAHFALARPINLSVRAARRQGLRW